MPDALDALVVNEADVARDEIAAALRPFLRFTRDGGLLLEPGFEALSTENQVLCLLLGLRALEMLGLRRTAQASPTELVELSGMAAGTVRPKLSALRKSRRIIRVGSSYELPVHLARRAIQTLNRGPNER